MPNLTNYDTTQIIDVVSKGINSRLMRDEMPSTEELKKLAADLTNIYLEVRYKVTLETAPSSTARPSLWKDPVKEEKFVNKADTPF